MKPEIRIFNNLEELSRAAADLFVEQANAIDRGTRSIFGCTQWRQDANSPLSIIGGGLS